jgi:hypothetical protein
VKNKEFEFQIEPASSGEDSDENKTVSKKAFPSVKEVAEEMTDSKMFEIIDETHAQLLLERRQHHLWLMFLSINDDFNKYKFDIYITNIMNTL